MLNNKKKFAKPTLTCVSSTARIAAFAMASLWLSGCGSPAATLGTVAKVALDASGLTKPEIPELQKPPRKVAMSISSGKNLNADVRGQPLAVVVRIYTLKSAASFYQAPYDAFVTPGRDKLTLGDDLLESREVTLIPGRDFNWTEVVPRTASAVGIVVLFHTPYEQRWRFAFDAAEAEKTGITMGAHACALTVTRGTPLPASGNAAQGAAAALNQLAQVNCKT